MNGGDQTDALWKTYPRALMRSLFFEISQKAADAVDDLNGGTTEPPVWTKEPTRVG